MYIEREFEEYPYFGEFYDMSIDEMLPLDEQTESKVTLLETICDIQEGGHGKSGDFIKSDYVVYLPFSESTDVSMLKNGILFVGNMNGIEVNGKVTGVFHSQLGGIKAYIQDTDA